MDRVAKVKKGSTMRLALLGRRLSSAASEAAASIIRKEMDTETMSRPFFRKKISMSDELSEEALKIYAELDADALQKTKLPKAYTMRRSEETVSWLQNCKTHIAGNNAKTPNHMPDGGVWEIERLFSVHANRVRAINLLIKWALEFAEMKNKYTPPKLQSAAIRAGSWLLAGFHQEDMPEGPRHHSTLLKKMNTPYNDDFATFVWHCIDAVAREDTIHQCWVIYVGLVSLPGIIPVTLLLENSIDRVQEVFCGSYDPVQKRIPDTYCIHLFEMAAKDGVWCTVNSLLSNIGVSLVSHLAERPQIEFARYNHALQTKNLLTNVYTYSKLK